MPSATFLLKLRFDSNGCTDKSVYNFGGVSFTETSSLHDGNKCAYFKPHDDNSALWVSNTSTLKQIGINNPFTIYLRYKINKDLLIDDFDTPILSYKIDGDAYNYPLLFIQEKGYFSLSIDKDEGFSSKFIDYTFDNKWHTLAITRSNGVIRFFIDGCLSTTNKSTHAPIFGDDIFIGRKMEDTRTASTLQGGYLDDICILKGCVYENDFIPPSLYFTGNDTIDNYFRHNKSNTDNIHQLVADVVEKKLRSTDFRINRLQRDLIPRRLRIKWYEERGYFRNTEYVRVPSSYTCTVISLYGMENPLYGREEFRFFEGNALRLFEENKIQAFMLFVNHEFIPLSRIDMVRSDWWYTVFIKDRDPDISPEVTSVEFVTIPFPIIYEEDLGEREDLQPLYVFDKDGMFNPSSGYAYYYMDKDRCKKSLKSLGTQEQYVPSQSDMRGDSGIYTDDMFMHSYWRYGLLETKNIDGNTAIMEFKDYNNHGWLRPGNQVILYKNTIMIDPSRYRIVGNNLIQFLDYKADNLDKNVVTMQIISDTRELFVEDLTTTKMVSVMATIDNQSVFNIPQINDNDGFLYRHFLLFRGSVCIDNHHRYIISDDYTTITFTNTKDYVPKGSSILFVFVKLSKSDQYGPLHVKPIYLYTRTDRVRPQNPDSYIYHVRIPELNGLKFNMNNVMMFVQDTFINPGRYKIENNTVSLIQAKDKLFHEKSVVFVLLKMANRFEDPIDDYDRVVKEELDKGKRFVLYDLAIDKKRKITLDNFVIFDQHGRYMPDIFGKVYNRNIIKCLYSSEPTIRVPRFLTCVYSEESLDNEANTILPTNDDFLTNYITLREEFYEMDDHFNEFMADFNVLYSKNNHYGENLAKALDYMVCYNQNKLDEAYKKLATISRYTFDNSTFNKNLIHTSGDPDGLNYQVLIDRDEYHDMYYRTYHLFFQNGKLANWFDKIKYTNNQCLVKLPSSLSNNDILEVISCHKMKNFLEPIQAKITPSYKTNIDFPCIVKVT